MRVSLIKKDKIVNFILPMQIHGNYWLTDNDKYQKERNLINITEENGKWKMSSNFEAKIYVEDNPEKFVILENKTFYTLKINKEEDVIIYCSEVYESNNYQLMLKNDCEIIVGSGDKSNICYKNKYIASEHLKLSYKNFEWNLTALTTDHYVFVNGERTNTMKLSNGDVIFVMGLKIIVLKNNIIINKVDSLKVDGSLFVSSKYPAQTIKEFDEEEEETEYYSDSDYFYRAPRFKNSVVKETLVVDPAPGKEKEDKTPTLLVIGPMVTMGMTSMVTTFTSINSIITNGRSLSEALPSILMSSAMLLSMVLWPTLTKKYQNKLRKEYEKKRQEKYSVYIEEKRKALKDIMKQQTDALIASYPSLDELKKVITYKKSNLWERGKDHDDFLCLRLGIGSKPVDIDINYPAEHFSLEEEDNLKSILNKLYSDSKDLDNVPITVSCTEKYISAIVGEYETIKDMTYGLLLQIMAYNGYDDVKIVIFTSKEKEKNWDFCRVLPHAWSNDKSVRYFASNVNDMKQISSILEPEFESRVFRDEDTSYSKDVNYKSFAPYYFIIIDDFKTARDIEIVKSVLDQKVNVGYSLLILNDKFTNLPKECMNFISIGQDKKSVVFEDELITNKQKKFIADIEPELDLKEYSSKLANIPILIENDDSYFPKILNFLEMYNVGKVEQLNSFNRWKVNSPINSLRAPVGVDSQGKLFDLDVHEKFHGPHGLIAGMTGSGKSEFIISYVLSLAVNYHPDEVSFILIDYKGGGVAGAFENKETGMVLPHIAGTITNLDTVEMKRSLVSIESELRRRQRIFNEARNKTNESTIDIYKYQKLYREGLVTEPISHLLIICDEFAELKVQQPDFMDQLISTARIGRSLGVHLILATQKPSGVVDDQIWSNSRFRICLKVQEKSDSMDMLKSPDAAMIKDVGRFYLQVGYNEFYALGQSAWCGGQYVPTDKFKKKIDNSVVFIDNIGNTVKNIDDTKKIMVNNVGQELTNVVKYLKDIAEEQNIKIKKLWLDRIPDLIYVDDIKKKYKYVSEPYIINPVVGEYDDPSNQRQDLLTLDLSHSGNAIIYGSSGSGENIFLSSIIYSSIIDHGPNEVNFYIMDFGSEMLKIFSNAPQVGDVLLINDNEKIDNLFKMLKGEIEKRKKLFVNYNGDFNFYNKKSENKMPLITIIVNNYEALYETYQDYEELLVQITRDGSRYGIIFVITTTGTNSIRYRMKQNFKQEYVLQMNDESDYSSVFGNVGGVYPSKCLGRGLIKKDKVYEFQSAHPYNPDKMSEYIVGVCNKLKEDLKEYANRIAVLPEVIKRKDINLKGIDLSEVPVGIDKDSLKVSTWDFENNYGTIITGSDMDSIEFFIEPLIRQFEGTNSSVFVLDSYDSLEIDFSGNIMYLNNNFNEIIHSLYQNIKSQYDAYVNSNYNKDILSKVKPAVCIMIGVDSLVNRLSETAKKEYADIIKYGEAVQTLKFIFIDSIDIFKKIEYNDWCKVVIKTNQGIWLGNGIRDQYTLKLSRLTRSMQQELGKDFGYVIKKGNAYLTKFLSSLEEE